MYPLWVTLAYGPWRIQDVQAALNVVINILNVLAAFVAVHVCYQRAVTKVMSGRQVQLHALYSIGNLSDILDISLLLKGQIFSRHYTLLIMQCLVVILFSTSTILSGVIARYSTRRALDVEAQPVRGYLASRAFQDITFANVEWNATMRMLDHARFPNNQLLDFLPYDTVPWVYEAEQWNNSWSLDCKETQQTPLQMRTTGNCSNGWTSELSSLSQAFPYSDYDTFSVNGWGYGPETFQNMLMFWYGHNKQDFDNSSRTTTSLTFALTALHLHGVSKASTPSSCTFGRGDVEAAAFTRIECKVNRRKDVQDASNVAYPDTDVIDNLPRAYTQYFQARFEQQGTSNEPIQVVTPDQMIRFYQAYIIAKDIRLRQPVERTISVETNVVQVSMISITVIAFVTFLVLVGLVNYAVYWYRKSKAPFFPPSSKLDWLMQSLYQKEEHMPVSGIDTTKRDENYTSGFTPGQLARKRDPLEQRNIFEASKFDGTGVSFANVSDATEELNDHQKSYTRVAQNEITRPMLDRSMS